MNGRVEQSIGGFIIRNGEGINGLRVSPGRAVAKEKTGSRNARSTGVLLEDRGGRGRTVVDGDG